MRLEEAIDIAKEAISSPAYSKTTEEILEARLTIAIVMIEQYQFDIRNFGRPGMCDGSFYRDMERLVRLGRMPTVKDESPVLVCPKCGKNYSLSEVALGADLLLGCPDCAKKAGDEAYGPQ
jgi:hypothetical protein